MLFLSPTGLALKTYNVRETKFDDSKLFDTFIGGYLELKRDRAKQLIERQKPNEPQNTRGGMSTKPVVQSTVSIPKLTSNTLSDKSFIAEINKQRKLVNNLFVTGIPRNRNYRDLIGIFKKVCQKLSIEIDIEDVQKAFQYPNSPGMVIELKRKDIKMKILARSMERTIPTSDLFTQKDPRIQMYVRQFLINLIFIKKIK